MASIIRKGEIPHTPQGFGAGDTVDEVYSLKGFFGDWAHLWRSRNPGIPKAWSSDALIYNGLDGNLLEPTDLTDPAGSPLTLLRGDGVRISVSRRSEGMPFAEKNCDFHQIRFYHRGGFQLETELGPLEVGPGDFAVIPRGMMFRETPAGSDNIVVVYEVRSPISLAEKIQDAAGMSSLFIDYSTMTLPEPTQRTGPELDVETRVRVRFRGEHHFVTYDFDPLHDVMGWIGDPVAFKMNVWDIPSLGSSFGFTSPPTNAVLYGEDMSFIFNVIGAKPFSYGSSTQASYGASSHLNDGDEVWWNHAAELAPETDGHLWMLPSTVPHPGLKVPPMSAPDPSHAIREVKLNFDVPGPLEWTAEAREAFFPDPTTALFTSAYGAHAGVDATKALEHVRR